jgi:hypothetical protein
MTAGKSSDKKRLYLGPALRIRVGEERLVVEAVLGSD